MRDKGLHATRAEVVSHVIHGDRVVEVEVQELVLPADGDEPPLAVERTQLAAERSGVRPPVLLIHGFAQNRYTWRIEGRSMCAALAEAGFDVYNLELRGHGRSRGLRPENATSFDDYVRDGLRVVQSIAVAGRAPFLIGHSLGGAVGVGVATETPLAGLVHLAGIYTFASQNRTLRAVARATLKMEPALRRSRLRLSTGLAGELLGQLYRVTEVAGYGFPVRGWVPESIERPLLEERLARGFDWTSIEVWLQMARWAQGERFAYREAWAGTDVPLLVAYGDDDPLVREGDAAACFEESGSADKELQVFDAFHHDVHWGHVDLILGKKAPDHVWPRLVQWMGDRIPPLAP